VGEEVEFAVYVDARGADRFRTVFPTASSTPVEAGWEDRWRKFHTGALVAGLWIGPPWETAPTDVPAVVIEPGRAFGTGAHPTTRACVELLAGTTRGGLLDAGCGSGVLSIAAARMGFGPIVSVDVDEAALEATRANAERNGCELDVRLLDVLRGELPAAEVVVANIEVRAVIVLLRRWPGRTAITSGFLAHERPEVSGWSCEKRVELDGWAADRLVRETTV